MFCNKFFSASVLQDFKESHSYHTYLAVKLLSQAQAKAQANSSSPFAPALPLMWPPGAAPCQQQVCHVVGVSGFFQPGLKDVTTSTVTGRLLAVTVALLQPFSCLTPSSISSHLKSSCMWLCWSVCDCVHVHGLPVKQHSSRY